MNAPVAPNRLQILTSGFLAQSHKLYIDGKFVDAVSGETIEVVNPATGQVIASVPAGGAADVDKAVKAARKAFETGPWPQMTPTDRAKLLWKLAEAIEADAENLAWIESLDNGMPVGMAMWGTGVCANNLRYNAGWAGKITGETPNLATPDRHAYTLKEPIGVVGAITPWNFPLGMEVAKISPALAAGCTVVLKPAELTPLTAMRLAELIEQCGFPAGVVNIVTGYGDPAGKALVEHPDVDKISFTGSTATGKWIVQSAAKTLKRVSLELGGKSPVIVFPDADLEKAIPEAAMGIFGNSGQVCVAGSRLYVHKDVFDRVVEGVTEIASNITIGSGQDPTTQMGPLVSAGQLERVTGYINSGKEQGGEVVIGGGSVDGAGFFMKPTVLAQTSADMRVVREEIFGPVVCAMPIDNDDLDKVAAIANDTTYGLAAYVWTRDISIAHQMAKKIKAGTVSVNGRAGIEASLPMGGYKQSGWGRENGREGVEEYFETKSVVVTL